MVRLIISMKQQSDRMIQQAAEAILEGKQWIQLEWGAVLKRIKENNTLIECGHGCTEQLEGMIQLFWRYLPDFINNNSETVFKKLEADWTSQQRNTLHSHQLILLFTMLENALHQALNEKIDPDYLTRQAIQQFLTQIAQRFMRQTTMELVNVDQYVRELFRKKENPFLWAAKIDRMDDQFQVSHFILHQTMTLDDLWKQMMKSIQAPSLHYLSDAILRLLSGTGDNRQVDVFPLSIDQDTYLFCIPQSESNRIKPFFTLSLELLKQNEHLFETMQVKNDWKDSLILFDEWIMLANNFEEAIDKVVSGFVHYLPFKRAALFYYSENENGEEIGVGIIGHEINNRAIRSIRENLNTIPNIKKPLGRIQPFFVEKAETILPEKFIEQFQLGSLVIAPIYSPSNKRVWGGVFLDQGEGKHFNLSTTMMSIIKKFGQHAGEVLAKYSTHLDQGLPTAQVALSNREIQILKLMAEGKTIDEAADSLFLSKYTVRDYVSDIIKKMDAQNRTHAIAKAIRHGLI